MSDPVYAVDFESYYDDEVSIRPLGVHNYLRHPDCDVYRVSIVGEGLEWVGHPDDAPWDRIDGAVWVAHNAAFDRAVYEHLGYAARPSAWHCTANMAVALDAGRSLLEASRNLLGVRVDKSTRSNMFAKRWDDLPANDADRDALTVADIPEAWQGKKPWAKLTDKRREGIPTQLELDEYALEDSRLCYRLWVEHSHRVPPGETDASDHTVLMTTRGIGVDAAGAAEAHDTVQAALVDARNSIPWVNEEGVALLSTERFEQELSRLRLPVPETTNKNDEEFQIWLEDHVADAPFVEAFAKLRSLTKVASVVESFHRFADAATGRLYYGLKYAGAHTFRWSGDAGLNLQNLPRPDTVARLGLPVDPRSLLMAPEGKTFVVADYSQIEARVALWLAGDYAQLAPMEAGMDIYEAHARATMGYSDPRPLKEGDPDLRKLAKARVLGLGFGCGKDKFRTVARIMAGLVLTPEECAETVADYRRTNAKIVAKWGELNRQLNAALAEAENRYEIHLPSGRALRYYNVRRRVDPMRKRSDTVADRSPYVSPQAEGYKLYGGALFENLTQAVARDILRDAVIRLEAAGFPVVLHVHDEVIVEVPEDTATDACKAIADIMCARPVWASRLPLAVEAHACKRYTK